MEYLFYIIDSFIRINAILMDNLPSNLARFINSIKYHEFAYFEIYLKEL